MLNGEFKLKCSRDNCNNVVTHFAENICNYHIKHRKLITIPWTKTQCNVWFKRNYGKFNKKEWKWKFNKDDKCWQLYHIWSYDYQELPSHTYITNNFQENISKKHSEGEYLFYDSFYSTKEVFDV